ncbi:hypothetical protein CCACVL1_17986 [Corchorus capsularis]|uniref:Uncharacterized protein n=1 Tax=Corchorus capsularis TaxID=210143 RepID=A0A1R3HNS6_COCAP|nr:hypothetical protein CCACVL1_17986 [Corchorus capsularis]
MAMKPNCQYLPESGILPKSPLLILELPPRNIIRRANQNSSDDSEDDEELALEDEDIRAYLLAEGEEKTDDEREHNEPRLEDDHDFDLGT